MPNPCMFSSSNRPWLIGLVLLLLAPWSRAGDVLLIVGDSLSAGYGLEQDQAWPALLEHRLKRLGSDIRVVNASISGETSLSGRARLPGLLKRHRPRWVVIELGANDGLRGLALSALRANIEAMQRMVLDAGAQPVLAGMRMPPNYGPVYADGFADIFARPVDGGALIPFLLDGVAGVEALNQPDGIHPTAEGQRLMLENVWRTLAPLIGQDKQVETEKKTVIDSLK